MSDIKEETLRKLEALAQTDRRRKEVAEKKLFVEERKIDNEIEKITKNDRELDLAKTTDYGGMTDEQIIKTQKDSREYLEAAKNCMEFINESFNGRVPYFRKNLILIGGKTGEGKSTTIANIVASTIKQKNPVTGKNCRVLVITNEEKTEDVYNRITCFARGWNYVNHDKFTSEQSLMFERYISILSRAVTVVDDSFGSTPEAPISGVTTSIEGIQGIFDNLIRTGQYYDAVLIDYYQNVKFSKKNVYMNEWEVQAQLTAILDQYKSSYPAPIVLMCQVSPPNEENTIPFKTRIEGRKVILNACTACLEMVADRENLRTEWFLHKSRFNENVGQSFFTGYDSGRFVPWTVDFQTKIAKMKETKAAREQDKLIGMPLEKKNAEVQEETSCN